MEYGCIGEKLSHSYSPEIHSMLGDYEYSLKELPPSEVESFILKGDFKGINVTIPYKQTVLKYLDHIDEAALKVGAVNTVVKRNNRLYGYNTDIFGLSNLLIHAKTDLSCKTVAILGSGGTSKTAYAVSTMQGAKKILRVSRSVCNGCITYDELKQKDKDIDVIINTTPCGMFPDINGYPPDFDISFSSYGNNGQSAVIDAVYNPLRTKLVISARRHNITAYGGLYMLVSQAVAASRLFFGEPISNSASADLSADIEAKVSSVFFGLLLNKVNIVLIGMPGCGKTTVGRILARQLGKKHYDSDDMIIEREGKSIVEIFSTRGERYFRKSESDVIKDALAYKTGCVISTGGGAVLDSANIDALSKNGIIIFIDRPTELLGADRGRPLVKNKDALKKIYAERYKKYLSSADIHIYADGDPEENSNKIINAINHKLTEFF